MTTLQVRDLHNHTLDTMTASIETYWLARTPADEAEGIDWYARARALARRLHRETGVPFRRCAAIIAVLSPALEWSDPSGSGRDNVTYASRLCRGDDPWSETMAGRAGWAVMHANVDKAVRLLAGEDIDGIVSGPKVTAFYGAIVGTGRTATVDRHAVRVATRGEYDGVSKATYPIVAEAYAIVAERLGVDVHTLQAVTWCVMRRSLGH